MLPPADGALEYSAVPGPYNTEAPTRLAFANTNVARRALVWARQLARKTNQVPGHHGDMGAHPRRAGGKPAVPIGLVPQASSDFCGTGLGDPLAGFRLLLTIALLADRDRSGRAVCALLRVRLGDSVPWQHRRPGRGSFPRDRRISRHYPLYG